VIGIDLGTTYSCVGIFKNGRVEIIANDQGNRITPSYVAFTSEGERLIGDAAKNQLTSNPESKSISSCPLLLTNHVSISLDTVFDAKRLIGREFTDPSVQQDIKHFPFKVIEKNSKPIIQISTGKDDKLFTPEEISAMVLGKMREIAVSQHLFPSDRSISVLFFCRKLILARKSLMLLSLFQLISMMHNVKQQKMLVLSLV
jgi:molecular chaperone DnaK (HSP70)